MKVSVLINNYNYASYLEECINSVINQTYKDIEIILYDDGSIDNSLEVASSFGDKIQIIANPNHKKYPSLNQANAIYQAFLKSTGEIICLLDSDDVFELKKVELIVEKFKECDDLVMIQHLMSQIDQNSKYVKGIKKSGLLIYNESDYFNFIQKVNISTQLFMQTSALTFRRNYLQKVLPLIDDGNLFIWPDVRLSTESIYNGQIYTFNLPLTKYRVHSLNDSKKLLDKSHFDNFFVQYHDFLTRLSKKYKMSKLNNFDSPKDRIKSIFTVISSKMKRSDKLFFVRGTVVKLPVIHRINKAFNSK